MTPCLYNLSKTHNPSLFREKQYRDSNRGTSLQNPTPNNSQGHTHTHTHTHQQRNSKELS